MLSWLGIILLLIVGVWAGFFAGFFAIFACIWISIKSYHNNLYFPTHSYFRFFSKSSKEERKAFSERSEMLGKYPHIGETVFMEDCILFRKFGVVIKYEDVESITYVKKNAGSYADHGAYVYLLIFYLKNKKKYICRVYNDDHFFVGEDCEYIRALNLFHQKSKKGNISDASVCPSEP